MSENEQVYLNELFGLSGSTALSTGSWQGIGYALGRGLARAGTKVALNGRDSARRKAAAEALRAEVATLAFDVTRRNEVRAAIDGFEASFGAIDILVNRAGMQHHSPLHEFPPEKFDQLLWTNIGLVFHSGQACARHMVGRGRSKIINFASVQTALACPGIAPYTATKGTVGNLTNGMATDWARFDLSRKAIAPGCFNTRLNATLAADATFSGWLEGRMPAVRWGQVEVLVGACTYLSSDASSFVNGLLYSSKVPSVFPSKERHLVLMSLSGCGPPSVGAALSDLTGIAYRDGDGRHSPKNLAMMRAGTPLVDDDRNPWLERCDAGVSIALQVAEPRRLVPQTPSPRHPALANVVHQPHHGSATTKTQKAMGGSVRANLAVNFAGKPLLTSGL